MLANVCIVADQELEATNFTWPFLKAVDPEEYPQYYVQISNPIDLSIIRTRVESKRFVATVDVRFLTCVRDNGAMVFHLVW